TKRKGHQTVDLPKPCPEIEPRGEEGGPALARHSAPEPLLAEAPVPQEDCPPVTRLTHPLAVIGQLPPDLLAAFNSAIHFATTSHCIRTIVLTGGSPGRQDAVRVEKMVRTLEAQWNECRAAILGVVN